MARENIKLDDKQLNEESAKKMLNPYSFTDRILRFGFNIHLESHHNNDAYSKITIEPKFSERGTEFRYNNKFFNEMAAIYARFINQ